MDFIRLKAKQDSGLSADIAGHYLGAATWSATGMMSDLNATSATPRAYLLKLNSKRTDIKWQKIYLYVKEGGIDYEHSVKSIRLAARNTSRGPTAALLTFAGGHI